MTLSEMIEQAKVLGRKAFENGDSQIPAQSKALMKLIEDFKVKPGENGCDILSAFYNEWHAACDESFDFEVM